MKKVLVVIVYIVYFLAFAGLVLLLLPREAVQNAAKAETPAESVFENAPEDIMPGGKYIILTFDDGWSSQYEAYEQLKQYNYKGTLYIISSLIGKEDRLTAEELKAMYEAGWDVCNHTAGHKNLTKLSAEEVSGEIYGCSRWIESHGFTRNSGYRHFAYPEGAYNEDVIAVLKQQGFLTARTTNAGSDTSDLLKLGRASLHGMTKKNIRDLILSDQELIILSLHRIVPDDSAQISDIDLKQSYFDEVIGAIFDSGREVITITEWYEMRESI